MTFSDWIDAERGRVALVAGRFGITMSAVTQWRSNGVPIERMVELRELADGEVSIEEMVTERQQSAPREAA
jgi:hypothetical protein